MEQEALIRELQELRAENAAIRKENQEMRKQNQILINKIEELTIAIKVKQTLRKEDYSSDESSVSTVGTKRRKTRGNKTNQPAETNPNPLSNRFEMLMDDDDLGNDIPESNEEVAENNAPNTPNSQTETTTVSQEKIPPIVLRQKEKWAKLSQAIKVNKINVSKAQTIRDGIRIHPMTATDYRKITKILNDEDMQYHTYQLPSEKLLHIVIKGIPEPTDPEEILEDLKNKNFHPETVKKMYRRKDKAPLPMMLITLPKEEKNIYQLTHVINLKVTVESQKHRTEVGQCHRCQRFGHSQSKCTATPRCVKCAGSHITSECKKEKNTSAKCANCGGSHTASYRGCTSWPQLPSKENQKPARRVSEEFSYASASTPMGSQKTEPTFSDLYTQMKAMFAQMENMAHRLGMNQPDKQKTSNKK